MIAYQPSDTYKYLWKEIIEVLLASICDNNKKLYAVHGDSQLHYKIGQKFEEYRNNSKKYMSSDRLDRHKLASCLCGAIIEVQPIDCLNTQISSQDTVNETLALYSGLNIVKYFMMQELLSKLNLCESDKQKALLYIKENFDMEAPSINENICDKRTYRQNLTNALYRTHHKCEGKKYQECFHFDIWAYAKIFYHLEVYNQKRLQKFYNEYLEKGE